MIFDDDDGFWHEHDCEEWIPPVRTKVTKVWTTKDGTRIRICDMTDDHLANAISFLERMAKKEFSGNQDLAEQARGFFGPNSMAAYQIEFSFDEEEDWTYYLPPIYDSLVRERVRRKRVNKG